MYCRLSSQVSTSAVLYRPDPPPLPTASRAAGATRGRCLMMGLLFGNRLFMFGARSSREKIYSRYTAEGRSARGAAKRWATGDAISAP